MNWVDYAILASFFLSALWGWVQGLLQTVLALLNWFAATFIAAFFVHELAVVLSTFSPIIEVRLLLAFVFLFSFTLLLTSWLNYLFMYTFLNTPIIWADSVLSLLLGGLRGILVILNLLLLTALTPLVQTSGWQASQLIPYFSILTHQITGFP